MEDEENLNVSFSLSENNNFNSVFVIEQTEGFDTTFEVNAAPYKTSQLINDSFIESVVGSELIDIQTTDSSVVILSETYVFEQGVASDIWEINHNLNKFPSVTLVDTAGTQFQGRVEYIDKNNCTVYMNGATKGRAYLN